MQVGSLVSSRAHPPVQVYIADCTQHLRNIIIKGMTEKATEILKTKLEDDLSEFSSFDRMSVDCMDLIRAAYKELHGGGAYAKGKGREFLAWVNANFPSDIWMPIERSEGSRQDLAFDGALPLYMVRGTILRFLYGLMVPGANNKLEKFLYRVLRCNEMVALLRCCSLWDLIFSKPVRFLNGSASKLRDWGVDSASEIWDLTEKLMVNVAADGHTLLDPDLDPCAVL